MQVLTLAAVLRKAGLVAAVAATTIVAFPIHASAGPFTLAEVRASTRGPVDGGGSHVDTGSQVSDSGGLVVRSVFSQTDESTASADAAAKLGFLRGQNFVHFPAFAGGDAFSQAAAEWGDLFTLDVAGHTGEEALLKASAWVHGFVDITGSTDARVTTSARIGSTSIGGPNVQARPGGEFRNGQLADPVPDGHFSFNEPFLIEAMITLGTPFQFTLSMLTEMSRFDTSSGSGDIQMGSTITWNGISSVTVGGLPVSTYTFASGSGLDYRNSFLTTAPPAAVPEPATALLVLTGLAAAARRRFAARTDRA